MLCLCHYSFPLSSLLSLSLSLSHPLLFIMHAHSLCPPPHTRAHTRTHKHILPSLSSSLSSIPSLLMFWRWHTLQKPHDLWHCLVGQLLFPSLINFDVEPNEIRQLIKAAADSALIYSCDWHQSKWQKKKKLMRRSLYVSSGPRVNGETDRGFALGITAECGSPQRFPVCDFLSPRLSLGGPSSLLQALIVQLIAQVVYLWEPDGSACTKPCPSPDLQGVRP